MTVFEIDTLIDMAIFATRSPWVWLLSMAVSVSMTFDYMQAGQTLLMFCALQAAMMAGVCYAKVRDLREGAL